VQKPIRPSTHKQSFRLILEVKTKNIILGGWRNERDHDVTGPYPMIWKIEWYIAAKQTPGQNFPRVIDGYALMTKGD
jgi:hypothetical protein